MSYRTNPNLLKVPLNIAGKSVEELQRQYGIEDLLKLASNENALGPSPMAMEAAHKILSEAHRYPGILENDLRKAIAMHFHSSFDERNVLVSNGASDVIRMIAQSFIFDGGEMVTCSASFPLYHICTTMFGGKPILTPPTQSLGFDFKAIASAITTDTRLIFLCAPNNPTGLIFGKSELADFMKQVPEDVVVVFDEAYFDFVDESADYGIGVEYILAGRNAIVVRSFSKSAGLAGMRVGYAVSTPGIIEYLHHAQLPFSNAAVALAAARASLDDYKYLKRGKQLAREEREWLYAAFDSLDLTYVKSQANFILLTDLPVLAATLNEELLQRGVFIRPMAAWGMPNAVRITIGLRAENEKLIEALGEILEEK